MQEYKDYFFSRIGSSEGQPANNWKQALESLPGQGFGVNPKPGERQPPDALHHGISVMIDGGGNARGRIWLPTDTATTDHNGNQWFTHEVQVIADGPEPGTFVWAWDSKSGHAPRPFKADPSQPAPGPSQPTTPQPPDGHVAQLLEQILEEQRTTNRKLDEQRRSVEKAAQQLVRALAGGGLLGALGSRKTAKPKARR
jgi:hypothetical protein